MNVYIRIFPSHHWWHPQFVYKQRALVSLAKYYVEKSEWQQLMAIGQLMAAEDPRSYLGYYWQGLAHQKLGNEDAAIISYYQSVEKSRYGNPALVNLAKLLVDKGLYYQASILLSFTDQLFTLTPEEPFNSQFEAIKEILHEKF